MKRPTQLDVARKAGVSRSTVSFVLNDQDGGRIPISAETRQRVLDAISELGYEPDARAQSLRGGSTKTIGVLVPIYENPYFWQLLQGISFEAEAEGYSVLLSPSKLSIEQERKSLRELAEQRVDGMILLISFNLLPKQILQQVRKSLRPVVEITSGDSEFDTVHQGYGDGTRALMKYLFGLGHQRIGFIYGTTDLIQGYDRLLPYREMLKQTGIGIDESLIIQCHPGLEGGYHAAREMLSRKDRPTAVLTINDLQATAFIRAAFELGLRIPNDMSLASFDNIPSAQYTVPSLTTVAGEPEKNGRDAVRLLLNRIAEPELPRQLITSGWELIIRESTGFAPPI